MKILSFDTSSSAIQLALLDGSHPVLERYLEPAKKNRQESASLLLPSIDAALKEVGWDKRDIDVVCVGVGPGSFTGVRVSVITARSLGQALNLPVVGISSLEAISFAAARPCAVIMAAGSDKFFAAAYEDAKDGQTVTLVSPFCDGIDVLKNKLEGVKPWLVDVPSQYSIEQSGQACHPYPEVKNMATLGALLTSDRLSLKGAGRASGETRQTLLAKHPWQSVVPLYLRNPSVTLKANHGITNTAPDPC